LTVHLSFPSLPFSFLFPCDAFGGKEESWRETEETKRK
jgi:hypothetical protein